MDKEEAKFLLASFRPCGADAADPSFKDALEFALRDQELSEWLVKERTFDSHFTECLNSLKVPSDLRGQLSELLEPRLDENTTDELKVIGALATIEPPSHLRTEILNAMQVASKSRPAKAVFKPKRKLSYWFPLAMAAMITLGLFLGFSTVSKENTTLVSTRSMAEESKRILTQANFSLDYREQNFLKVVSWASEKEIPTPTNLPVTLEGEETIGCKEITIEGKTAALICFQTERFGTLHLIVMESDDIEGCNGVLPCINTVRETCYTCPHSGCTTAQWHHDGKAYMLISKTQPVEQFQEIF